MCVCKYTHTHTLSLFLSFPFLLQFNSGIVHDSEDLIILEDVPIITPNKDVVVSKLSFKVRLSV